jgi:hypothetical protein
MPSKKRKPATATVENPAPAAVETQAPAEVPGVDEPDVFDQAIAAQAISQMAASRAPAGEPARAETAPAAEGGPAAPATAFQPDPFSAMSVSLGDTPDAPRVHLYRNRRMNQVAIRFDEKPAEPVRRRLRDEGYKWREAEGVWTKQLGDQRATGQLAAERLVGDIANGVRAEAGLPPVGRAVGE